jgi:hypothetical protein
LYAEHHDELEAERNREHAKFMADWREAMKRNRETMLENRRKAEGVQSVPR